MERILIVLGCVAEKARNLLCRARGAYLTNLLHRYGSKGRVTGDVRIINPERIYIGDDSYINGGMIRASKNARITIGDNCMVSYGVHIRTDTHAHDDSSIPMRQQGCAEKDITIEDDVWVGYGAQIMPGLTIGKGSIVGAGAVVTKDVPPYTVVGGVPAKVIQSRLPEDALKTELPRLRSAEGRTASLGKGAIDE